MLDNTTQNRERFFKGDEFISATGYKMRYKKWSNDQETLSLNNNWFAYIKSYSKLSFTIQIAGVKKKMEETIAFKDLNFRK